MSSKGSNLILIIALKFALVDLLMIHAAGNLIPEKSDSDYQLFKNSHS